MTCNRYHLWAALDVHAFSKAEAVLRFSAEEDGMWVQWQDYARLKAEVERLRKAGDAMADAINEHRHGKGGAWGKGFIVREKWKTAKEGKPSV